MDEAGAGAALEGIEQEIDVFEGAAAALRGEAGGLVEDDRGGIAVDDHRVGLFDLRLGQGFAGADAAAGAGDQVLARRHAQGLAGGEAVLGRGALAIDADLAGAGPAADRGEADLRQVALEPAIEADAVVIVADSELADVVRPGGAVVGAAHAKARIV